MSAAQLNAEPLSESQATALLRQVALSQATRLAREGSYSAAEELLTGLLKTDAHDISILDLLARIRAQQGALLDAASLWRKVQQLDPNHLGAAAGLERLRAAHRRPFWLQSALALLVGMAMILCGVLIFKWQARRQTATRIEFEQKLVELAKAGDAIDGQQAKALVAQVEAVKASQAKSEAALSKLENFSGRLDSWAITQGAQSQTFSNQMASLQQAFAVESAAAKSNFEQRLRVLQADMTRLSAQQDAAVQSLSNQTVALGLSINREREMAGEIEERRAANDKLQTDYRTLVAKQEQLLVQAGMMTSVPAVLGDSPGVKTAIAGKSVVVVFEDGLFDHGSHFKIGGKERLAATLKTLAQSKEPLAIEVVGYSDGDQGFFGPPDTYTLGLKRASTVVDFIRISTLFSPSQLRASSGGSSQLPFPSDTEKNRSRNRTAVLKISRGEK